MHFNSGNKLAMVSTSIQIDPARERINALAPGRTITLFKISPAGALQARRELRGDVSFYWRFSFGENTFRERIGYFDPKLPPKSLQPLVGRFSIAAARRSAEELALAHVNSKGIGGFRALKEAQRKSERQAKEDALRQAEEQAEKTQRSQKAAELARLYTLEALLAAYVEHLRKQEKHSSAYDAENMFKNHVVKAAPSVAALPAREVSADTVVEILRTLNDAEKRRTANKLRSYLGSAFNHALRARRDPSLPAEFKGFEVYSNPVTGTFRIRSADREDKNPLPIEDLRKYWCEIQKIDGIAGAVLRLHVLTGGQRIAQLVRATRSDDFGDSLRLADTKGRRSTPRVHYVPLVAAARKELDVLLRSVSGEFLFSTTNGDKSINQLTLTRWAADAAARAQIQRFSAKRVRSGIETVLSAHGIRKEYRAQLQSHGISGVQDLHYDGHDYHAEKFGALTDLMRLLRDPDTPGVPDSRTASGSIRPRRSAIVRRPGQIRPWSR
jgi:integrase